MGKADRGHVVGTCSFPPYCIKWIGQKYFLIGGGGGASKTGVPNKFEIYEMKSKDGRRIIEKVVEHETDIYPVMNAAVVTDGNNYTLAAGLDEFCQLYSLKYKVITPKADGDASVVRKRKGNLTNSVEHNDIKRMVTISAEEIKKVRTDFEDVQKTVTFNKDASLIATGGSDGHLRIWKNHTLDKVHDIAAHKDTISLVEFSPSGNQIVTVSFDKKATVWNVSDGKRFCDLVWEKKTDRPYKFRACRFFQQMDKKRTRLCTAHTPVQVSKPPSSYLTLWDTDAYKPYRITSTGTEILCSMAASDNGVFLATGGAEGTVTIYTAFNIAKIYQVRNIHKSVITDMVFAPASLLDEDREFSLLSICPDHDIRLHENTNRALYSPMWSIIGFVVLIYLFFWFISTYGL